jgi:glycosyltransferase involved in cell wall biosynthesis
MHKPTISVVLVVRNVERFLSESIESILGQTFSDFEFIIVDFGSTDGSKAIASTYAAKDSRIGLHEIPNCGLAEARNAGCSLAKGRYIAIMDADDVSAPDRLKREVAYMDEHPEVGLLGGATEWIDASGRSLHIDYPPTENREIKSDLVTRCPFWQSSVLIRTDAFVLMGGYRAVFAQAEDYDLWLRISERYQCANLKEVVLKYRIHPYQLTLRKQKEQTLCKLAARASASSRRERSFDPLDACSEITPALLVGLGMTEGILENAWVSDCHDWILNMAKAHEHSAALKAADDLLHADLKYVEKWQIADLYLTISRLHWRERRFWQGGLAASRAVIIRPVVVGRPLKPLLRRFGLV